MESLVSILLLLFTVGRQKSDERKTKAQQAAEDVKADLGDQPARTIGEVRTLDPLIDPGAVDPEDLDRVCELLELDDEQCTALKQANAKGITLDEIVDKGCEEFFDWLPFCEELVGKLIGWLSGPGTPYHAINEALNGPCVVSKARSALEDGPAHLTCYRYENGCEPFSNRTGKSQCEPGTYSWCLDGWSTGWADSRDACRYSINCGLLDFNCSGPLDGDTGGNLE